MEKSLKEEIKLSERKKFKYLVSKENFKKRLITTKQTNKLIENNKTIIKVLISALVLPFKETIIETKDMIKIKKKLSVLIPMPIKDLYLSILNKKEKKYQIGNRINKISNFEKKIFF